MSRVMRIFDTNLEKDKELIDIKDAILWISHCIHKSELVGYDLDGNIFDHMYLLRRIQHHLLRRYHQVSKIPYTQFYYSESE